MTATQSWLHVKFSVDKLLPGSVLIYSVVVFFLFYLRIQHHFHCTRGVKVVLQAFHGLKIQLAAKTCLFFRNPLILLLVDMNMHKNPAGVAGAPSVSQLFHGEHSPTGLASASKWLAACDRFSGSSPGQ